MIALFDPKIIISPTAWWAIGGIITGIGVVLGATVKVMTRGYITKREAYEKLQSEKTCIIISGEVKADLKEIKADQKVIATDIKEILKNGRR